MARLSSLSLIVAASLLFAQHAISQDAKPGAKPADNKAAEKPVKGKPGAPAANKAKGRLPAYYGQIGLDEAQKMQIYNVQAKFSPDIEKAEQALKELRAKELEEVDAVLTADQKTKLAELKEAAKAKGKAAKPADAAAGAVKQTGEKPAGEKPAGDKAAEKKPTEKK